MDVLLVADVLVVEAVCTDELLAVRGAQQRNEVALEVGAEALDVLARVLADDLDLADVGLGLDVALEAICITCLFITSLAIPLLHVRIRLL